MNRSEEKHCEIIVLDVLELAWRESETNRIVMDFLGMQRGVQVEEESRIRKMLSHRQSVEKLEQQKAREKKQEIAKIKKLEWDSFTFNRSLVKDIIETLQTVGRL